MPTSGNPPRQEHSGSSTEGTIGESDKLKTAQRLAPHAAFDNSQGTETLGVAREEDRTPDAVDERATSPDVLTGTQPEHDQPESLKTDAAMVEGFSGQSDDIPAAHNEIQDESPDSLPRNVIH